MDKTIMKKGCWIVKPRFGTGAYLYLGIVAVTSSFVSTALIFVFNAGPLAVILGCLAVAMFYFAFFQWQWVDSCG